MNLIDLAETGFVSDTLVRMGIRRLLGRRIRSTAPLPDSAAHAAESRSPVTEFAEQLRREPLAIATEQANQQHYEVPASFFEKVLGPRLKYSACLFRAAGNSLGEAEAAMLRETCERAEIEDGQRVLELGCGWGSLTLWLAEQYPNCSITAVSNSASQHDFIIERAAARGLTNVKVYTADMRTFELDEQFDRVVSVEMFEHMRNYELLFRKVAGWLTPEGKAFVHVFCHRDTPYVFETQGAANWMGRHFFTGGIMPAEQLFAEFDEDLSIERQWRVSGLHYWRTCEAWLANLDRHRAEILHLFSQDLPAREAKRQLQRWRMFFMACAELFRYRNGEEWFVAHYRFQRAEVPAGQVRALSNSASPASEPVKDTFDHFEKAEQSRGAEIALSESTLE